MKYKVEILVLVVISLISTMVLTPHQMKVKANSDNLIFENITIEDGLSQNIINCITQDHHGYLWFGTTVGLNRYDGINFQVFSSEQSAINSLYNSEIRALCEDSSHRLWVGTSYGLYLYNPETDTFTNYLSNPEISGTISNNIIRTIYCDSEERLWIGTTNGLNRYDPITDTFISYQNNLDNSDTISNNYIVTIYEDSRGSLWFGTSKGLNRYNSETDTFTSYEHDPDNPESISSDYILTIYEDSSGTLWIGTNEGLNFYTQNTNTFSSYKDINGLDIFGDDIITSVCEDDYGYLWIGTRSGLSRLNVLYTTLQAYKFDSNNSSSINSDSITAIYKDTEGILWIGTTKGISKLNLKRQFFQCYKGSFYDSVSAILEADNDKFWLWVGADLILYNYQYDITEKKYTDIFSNTNYKNSTTCDICMGNDGLIWFGTIGNGLKSFNSVTGMTNTYLNEPGNSNSLLDNIIISLYCDHTGIIWIGTSVGLCSFNPETQQFTRYQDSSIGHGSIYSIYETSDNIMWFGTESEIYALSRDTEKITLALPESDFDNIGLNRIETIYQDNTGLLWLGVGYNLYSYTLETQELILRDLGDISIQDFIFEIIEDKSGNIWFTNRQGLYKYSYKENDCKKYGIKDGLISNIFYEEAGYISGSGKLFFGTTEGLISFYPEEIVIDSSGPNVLINGFKLLNYDMSFNKAIEEIEEITLSYYQNSFDIDFIALHFNSPKNNEYAYFLAGFDENWRYCSAGENSTKYTNIPSGEYTFKVIAANSDGVWNTEGASLTITINPPFWQEWWFILLLTVIALFTVFGLIKFRTQSLGRHAEELKVQVEERTHQLAMKSAQLEKELDNRIQFTRALVHELKTPLTAMMGSSELLIEKPLDELGIKLAKNLNRGVNNLKRRIDELLDIAKGEMGTLNIVCKPANALTIVSELVDDITPEVVKKGQNIILDLPYSIPDVYVDSDRLRQILFNLIGNAIKYNSPKGTINIAVNQSDNFVVFSVQDQGMGISPEEQKGLFTLYYRGEIKNERLGGLGIGLALSKILTEIHGGKIWFKSQKGKGSTFSFSIPIMQKEDYLKIRGGQR